VADIIRIAGTRFRERDGASLLWPQVKVLLAIARCRTAALGGQSRSLYPLRMSHRHFLQLLSQSAVRNTRPTLAKSGLRPTGAAAGELFSSGLQRAALALSLDRWNVSQRIGI
jgi:hypothetical protein